MENVEMPTNRKPRVTTRRLPLLSLVVGHRLFVIAGDLVGVSIVETISRPREGAE